MSRIVIPPAYRLMIMSDRPPTRRWPFGTNRGSKVPLRSLGVARSTSPTSVPSRLPVDPFRELPEPCPARSCISEPRWSVSSAARPASNTRFTSSGKNPPSPVNCNEPSSTWAINSSSKPPRTNLSTASRAAPISGTGPAGSCAFVTTSIICAHFLRSVYTDNLIPPVQSLNLAFLIDREHHCLLWRIQVEPDDVADLRLQLGIGGELESLPPPRLQPPLPPDPCHPHIGDVELIGQQPARPVRHPEPLRGRLQRGQHDRDLINCGRPARLRPVLQPGDALRRITLLPRNHRRLRHPNSMHDLARAHSVIGEQHDPGPLSQSGPQRRRTQPPGQLSAVLRRQGHSTSQQRHS